MVRSSNRISGRAYAPLSMASLTLRRWVLQRMLALNWIRNVDVIVQRWHDPAGKKATFEGHGGTFDQVAIERREK